MITLFLLGILTVMVITILFIVMLTMAGTVALLPAIGLVGFLLIIDIAFFSLLKAIFGKKGGD